MPKVDVVIVNWNTGSFLSDCVKSLIDNGQDLTGKIIVVDNDSTDDSLANIENLKTITVIRNKKNLGFARGCNIGANIADNDYVLFLNPDARVYKDTLRSCLEFFENEQNKNIGILGVKLEDTNGNIGSRCSRFPSTLNIMSHAIGLDSMIPSLGSSMKEFDHLTTKVVDQIIGAFFLVRRKLFDELNGFDERFFMYMDEVDFSYRAKLMGYQSIYYAEATAFHHGEISTSKVQSLRLFYSLRSRLQYSWKHFGVLNITMIIFLTLIIEPISRFIQSVFKLSLGTFLTTFEAYAMLFIWIFQTKFLHKRRF